MIRKLAVVVALWSLPALAQESSGLGLDLTNDKKETPPPAANPPVTAEPTAEPPRPDAPQEQIMSEREITQDDRVKSVQRKVYLKKGRFEIMPMITVALNDPLYVKWGAVLRAGYYITDSLAIAVRGIYLDTVPIDDVRTAKQNFQSRIFFSRPNWAAIADLEWSPIYGKVTIFNSILHFDGYLLGGAGAIWTSASAAGSIGAKPAADMGVGLRFIVQDYLAVSVALINTAYVDQPVGTTKGATQNIMTLNAGISFFLPFRSTGREAE